MTPFTAGVGLPSSAIGASSNLAGGNFSIAPPAPTPAAPPNPGLSQLSGVSSYKPPAPTLTPVSSSLSPAIVKSSTPPTSPLTGAPVSSFASAASSSPYVPPEGIDTNYYMQPGETPAAYNARIDAYNQSLEGTSPTTLANGSVVSTDNNTGQVVSPSQFTIDNTSSVPSDALSKSLSSGDVTGAQSAYQNYVNGLATAQQYSPEYIAALTASNQAAATGANITSDFYTGAGGQQGDTTDYASGVTGRAMAQNQLQQLTAQQALGVQGLIRSGNIAAATALVQASQPQSVSPGSALVSPLDGSTAYSGLGGLVNYNEANSYSTLQSEYPDASIPAYDTSLSPAENQQNALAAVSSSPQYQAQYLQTYTTANGGTGVFNKLNSNALQANPDGTLTLVSGAAAALGSANAASLTNIVGNYNTTQTAFNTFNSTLSKVQQFMQQNGINESGIPVTNQIQDKIQQGLSNPGALAAYNADIQELRTNASAIVSRGNPSVNSDNEASSLVPSDLSPDQLGTLRSQIQSNGVSALNALQTQMTAITSQLNSGSSTSTSTDTSGSGSTTDYGDSFSSIMSSLQGG